MELINLTPHILNIHTPSGVENLPPSGQVARVDSESTPAAPIGGIPTFKEEGGQVTGLPEPREGVVFITSLRVSDEVCREDVVSPGHLVRDENGRPVGCRGLRRHSTRIQQAYQKGWTEGQRHL